VEKRYYTPINGQSAY